jgi:ribonuclease P protein component
MISSAHRFHGRSSLRFVYQRGQMVRGPLVALRYAHNDRQKQYRVAVVVSRKVSKSAVKRNRVRRRVYEIVRKRAAQITAPFDLIFTVYDESVADMQSASLSKAVVGLLQKAGTLAPSTDVKRGIVDKRGDSK